MFEKNFSKLCTPARIYFILALFSAGVVLYNGIPMLAVAMNLFIALIWTMFLAWICDKVSPIISWGLVLAPFVMIFLVGLGFMREIQYVKMLNPVQETSTSTTKEGLRKEFFMVARPINRVIV